MDKLVGQNKPLPVTQEQKYDSNGLLGVWRNFNKDVELKKASGLMLPNSEDLQGHVSTGTIGTHTADHVHSTYVNSVNLFPGHNSFTQQHASELQPPNTEADSIKNRISVLQHSISHLDSQLQKVSLRKDLLGRDSAGRLYWAFLRPGSSPWMVVEETLIVSQEQEDLNVLDRASESSLWLSYQSDAEIGELVRWLRANDPMARELIESILHLFKSGFTDSYEAGNFVLDMAQPSLKPIDTEISVSSDSLLTKALTMLEKKYVPCESDITNIQKPSENPEGFAKKKLFRCECLEPIWPSRHHCQSCHCSFSSTCELKEHNDGKCSSDAHVTDKFEQNNSLVKGRSTSRHEEGECSDKTTPRHPLRVGHENGTGFLKLARDPVSPYKLEEIGTKFATRSSNRELVKEIGLLGSNGFPSFVECASPYLSDPSLKLDPSWNSEISQSDKSMDVEKQLEPQQCLQGNSVTSKGQFNNPKDSSKSSVAGSLVWEVQKSEISGLMSERRDQSLHFSCTNPGNSSISVIRDYSLRPLVGRGAQILRQLKITLLDMDAALPEEALKPSKASMEKRCSWRAFVKAAKSVFQMVQATIVFESMIKTEYLRNDWWYWSSLSAAARIATISSLALRIYTLDAAIVYERKSPSSSPIESADDSATKSEDDSLFHTTPARIQQRRNAKPGLRNPSLHPSDSSKPQCKSSKKKKDSGG
uniref:WHIM2 domain-containing protein n=1 Tax=Rhizophora mucronata TaxID=61149 RepID=A0A2P2JCJ2_RHIMU